MMLVSRPTFGVASPSTRASRHSAGRSRARTSVGAALLHQDLDSGLVEVVAAPVAVVDAQDRLEIGQQVPPRQELAHHVADHRRAAEPPANEDLESDLIQVIFYCVQADIVYSYGSAVGHRPVHGD